jgi:hypothetical protein
LDQEELGGGFLPAARIAGVFLTFLTLAASSLISSIRPPHSKHLAPLAVEKTDLGIACLLPQRLHLQLGLTNRSSFLTALRIFKLSG